MFWKQLLAFALVFIRTNLTDKLSILNLWLDMHLCIMIVIDMLFRIIEKHFSCRFSFHCPRSNILSSLLWILNILHLVYAVIHHMILVVFYHNSSTHLFVYANATVFHGFNVFIFVALLATDCVHFEINCNSSLVLGSHWDASSVHMKVLTCLIHHWKAQSVYLVALV